MGAVRAIVLAVSHYRLSTINTCWRKRRRFPAKCGFCQNERSK